MKKIFFLLSIAAIVSCNSDGSGSSSEDTTGTNAAGIENVNGNLPDTTNSINIGSDSDTTHNDTTHNH